MIMSSVAIIINSQCSNTNTTSAGLKLNYFEARVGTIMILAPLKTSYEANLLRHFCRETPNR